MQLSLRDGQVVSTVKFDLPITVKSGEALTFSYTYTLGEEMPNSANRRNLKALMDLLSDAHAEITARACVVNEYLMKADNPTRGKDEQGKQRFSAFDLRYADRQLGELLIDLEEQNSRTLRVRDEVRAIRKNLKTI